MCSRKLNSTPLTSWPRRDLRCTHLVTFYNCTKENLLNLWWTTYWAAFGRMGHKLYEPDWYCAVCSIQLYLIDPYLIIPREETGAQHLWYPERWRRDGAQAHALREMKIEQDLLFLYSSTIRGFCFGTWTYVNQWGVTTFTEMGHFKGLRILKVSGNPWALYGIVEIFSNYHRIKEL